MTKQYWYIAIAAVLVYIFFIKKKAISVGATAGASLVPTGGAATPYSGYPPGMTPPGVPYGPSGTYGPLPPQPSTTIVQQGGDTTGSTLTGVGNLLGGLGQAAGSVLTGLGNSGLLGSSGGSYAGYGSSDDTSDASGLGL